MPGLFMAVGVRLAVSPVAVMMKPSDMLSKTMPLRVSQENPEADARVPSTPVDARAMERTHVWYRRNHAVDARRASSCGRVAAHGGRDGASRT
jgi:hypothetical protein